MQLIEDKEMTECVAITEGQAVSWENKEKEK